MDARPFEQVPSLLGQVATAVTRGSTRVIAASAPRWSPPDGIGEVNYLQRISFTQRLFVVDQRKQTWLVVIRPAPSQRVLVDAGIRVGLQAVSDVPSVGGTPSACESQYPSILLRDIPDPALLPSKTDPFSPGLLCLGLGANGDDILTVNLHARPPRMRFSPRGIPGPDEPQDGSYPLRPVLELLQALAVPSGGKGTAVVRPLPADSKPLAQLVSAMLGGYEQIAASLAEQNSLETREWLKHYFALASFEADATFRLRGDGKLADREDNELFLVEAGFAVDARRNPNVHVSVGLPAVVLPQERQGEWFHALLDSSANKYYAAIGHLLNISPQAARAFVDSANGQSIIVRCAREDSRSPSLVVLNGMLADAPTTVLLAVTFKGNSNPELDSSTSGEVCPGGAETPARIGVDRATATNFIKLLGLLRVWADLLA